ncbi:insulin-like growth factor-binding protein complex acid labile subunit [Anopheles moucheti]|uniref:insulin-like growth factor-binding protein complex acid labile subunit n=1 Tax=Anopheles moucheti TaxID=186751 RepID=UPI0022F132E1|nr:insulin-like growth factor-binding protein complex acid labile subunit [Anopheles moucheti]
MVKLCVVLVMVAIALPQSAFSKQLVCTMEPNRSCSLIGAKVSPDEITSTEFTSSNPSSLTRVQFARSSLAAIPPAMFQTFTKLETLNATASDIKQVQSNNFAGAKSLQSLFLDGNKIHDLPREAFFGAHRLQLLDLSNNAITTIDGTAFKRLRDLKTLLLGGNKITALDASVFDDLSELENLELQQNALSSISDAVFGGCPSLTTLNVSRNALKSFNLAQFERRWNFDLIDASHNHLASVRIPPNLRQLVAIGNGIRTVESTAVNGSELILLKLPHNKLTSMDDLPVFNKLISLDLSFNAIREFDFRSVARFGKLVLLKLDGNQLGSLSNGLTEPITHLKYVHLADNQFVHLDLDVLRTVPRVLKLDLRRNMLERLTVTDLSGSFPVMVRMMLEGNRFGCEDSQPLLKQLKGSITAYAMTRADCRKDQNLIDGICCS